MWHVPAVAARKLHVLAWTARDATRYSKPNPSAVPFKDEHQSGWNELFARENAVIYKV